MKILLCVPALAIGLLVPLLARGASFGPSGSAPATAAAETYEIDTTHSSSVFRAWHMGVAYFYGTFNHIEGTVVIDEAKPAQSSVKLTIPAESIDSANTKRDNHLKNADFLNATEFPDITFVSKKVAKKGDAYEVTGELTVRGVTKEKTVTVEQTGKRTGERGTKLGLHTEFEIDMNEFAMPAAKNMPDDALGDTVRIWLAIEANKQ